MLSEHLDWLLLAAMGGLSGFASGLLGIGGGLVIVPALIFTLPHFDIAAADVPKIAMATSLALIVPTSISSTQAHAARGAVDWPMMALLAPGIIAGSFLSAFLIPIVDTRLVVLFFVGFALVTAGQLLRRTSRACATQLAVQTKFPNPATTTLKGAAGGGLAAMLGIGGAFFIIPLLERFISMRRAIGTASALGIPLSLAGSAGYVLAAPPASCEQSCLGYVFFPAVAAIGTSAVLAAPMGAWLTHRSPLPALRRLFALFLICAAGMLAYKSFYPQLLGVGISVARAVTKDEIRPRPEIAIALPSRRQDIPAGQLDIAPPPPAHPPLAFATGELPEPAEPAEVFYPPAYYSSERAHIMWRR